MSLIYLFVFTGVVVALLALVFDAVASVSRAPSWGPLPRTFDPVQAVDRRHVDLPYVGVERRAARVETPAAPAAQRIAEAA